MATHSPGTEARTGTAPDAVTLTTVRLDGSHDAAVAEFFRQAWDAPPPPPDPAAPGFGLLVDGRLAGYIGTLPVRFWDGAQEHAGHWMKGFMVLPEFRNGSVGFLVLKEAVRQLEIAGSLSVAPAARRLFTAAGFRELGALSNQIALLRPWRVFGALDPGGLGLALPSWTIATLRFAQRSRIAALLGLGTGLLFAAWRLLSRLDTRQLQIASATPRPAEIDRLWHRLRRVMRLGVVRDAAHFARYRSGYRFVTVHDGSVLQGIAVVRLPRAEGDPRLRGIRVAVLAELVADPGRGAVQRALLRGAEALARRADADALLCSASYRPLQSLLRRQAYLPFPGNVRLLLRGEPASAQRPLGEWWLTRGDGHADEVF